MATSLDVYFPRKGIAMAFLDYTKKTPHCLQKGYARYFSVITKNEPIQNVAWTYEIPTLKMIRNKNHLALHTILTAYHALEHFILK